MASESTESGQVLSLLSHELRSPLGVVRGYLRLLNQHQLELSEQHRQAVTAALKASDRCVDLLAQASTLAQMWRDETSIGRLPIALADLLQSLEQAVRTADERAPRIEIGAVASASLSGDRALLVAALSSLIAAVHRAQADDVIVNVGARSSSNAGRDGVSIHVAPRDWSRDDAPQTPLDLRRGGLGLGLPIAAAIVEAHGGTIAEQRVEGRVAVVVWLPTS